MLGRHSLKRTNGVTDEDIAACYRLLLGRPPDADGLQYYRERLDSGSVSILDVVADLVASPEYAGIVRIRRADPPTTVVEAAGFRIHVLPTDHAIGQAMAATGEYEREVSAALKELLQPGSVFVDVGANYGWHSLSAAGIVGPSGRVVAVEPNPLNAGLLRRSVADNGFTNVEVVVAAAASEDTFGALETDGSNGRIIVLGAQTTEAVPCSYVVPLRRLDGLLEGCGVSRVDVMKVDVEGLEAAALRGAREVVERDRPVIVSEFFPSALWATGGIEPASYLRDLRDLGYRLRVVGHEGYLDDEAIMGSIQDSDHVDIVAVAG